MTRRFLSLSATLLGATVLLSGCQTVRETVTCPTVPPLRPETRPLPPVREETQIWQPGHWDWTGSNYLWREGRWILREGRGNLWMDGVWVRDSTLSACRWEPAHWVQ